LPGVIHAKRYRLRPGSALDLEEVDASDASGFKEGEASALRLSKEIDRKLDRLQERLYAEHKHSLLIVLQAMDTGGKDGTIRRIFDGVNPSGVRVAHFGVPSPEELAHDYLWRVHARVPAKGEIVIFNRSHYESVLVERVHGLITKEECKLRYRQINDFERMLVEEGTTILKFYLHIDSEEQKRRIRERIADPEKQWKFSLDDLKERKLWPKYMKAYERALEHTSTELAPWYVVPADKKWFRDLVVAAVVAETMESMHLEFPPLAHDLRSVVVR
jgi:PPK2 family polyphosphate:nucleotide phosphotransferase